jgi:hypothetical protein
MVFSKAGAWRISDCGFYRISQAGPGGRSAIYRLEVRLDDGWVEYPEAFKKLRDAKAAAVEMEHE